MSGTLTITRNDKACGIQLAGRVNFETVVPLRDFVNNLPSDIREIIVDLGECVSMDSTCMGVLSMLALKGMKEKLTLHMLNAGSNRQLLRGLGVEKLFHFEEGEFVPCAQIVYPEPGEEKSKDMETAANTVLDAHETLIEIDDENQQRFGAVVDMTRQDIERLKQRKKQ